MVERYNCNPGASWRWCKKKKLIGSEYINLKSPGKKEKLISEDLTEAEKKFIYRNKKGKVIFTPVYKKYNEYFFSDIISNTKLVPTFTKLRDTAIIERFMLNAAQFSAAKNAAECKLMQAQIFNDKNEVKAWNVFRDDCKQITDIVQETWLRVERETCIRSSVLGDQFRGMMRDSDLYPYWIYKGVMDEREREEHVAMEGLVFKIGDEEGDACYPPNGDNCRCEGEAVDDDYLQENNLKLASAEEVKEHLQNDVSPRFQFNPGTKGTLPNTGSYFDVLGSANEGSARIFDLEAPDTDEELTGLSSRYKAASGLHGIVATVHEWRDEYKLNKAGDIVFQNKQLKSNVIFTAGSLHAIKSHERGFENIPATIISPDEVWSFWQDIDRQRIVLRNYIKFGKTSYIVQTRDGVITDAFAVSNGGLGKYRKGVIL